MNIQSELIPRIATGFCGGIARTSGMCGAVSGAILAINLVYGRNDPSRPIDENYTKVREMLAAFEEKFGTTNCFELIDCDLATPAGQQKFKAEKLIEKCRGFTEEATRMTLSVIGNDVKV